MNTKEKKQEAISCDDYKNILQSMINQISDVKELRFYCILIHDYSNIEYP